MEEQVGEGASRGMRRLGLRWSQRSTPGLEAATTTRLLGRAAERMVEERVVEERMVEERVVEERVVEKTKWRRRRWRGERRQPHACKRR